MFESIAILLLHDFQHFIFKEKRWAVEKKTELLKMDF